MRPRITIALSSHRLETLDDARLLAARSLIHAAMSWKDEVPEDGDPFPHTRHEVEVLELVGLVSWEDCCRLFAAVRSKDPDQAREVVRRHLAAATR